MPCTVSRRERHQVVPLFKFPTFRSQPVPAGYFYRLVVKTRSLSIGFVTVADLPEGSGRTARLRSLVGALVSMGHPVRIWNEHGLECSGAEHASGELAGAPFEYVLGTTTRRYGFRAATLKIRAVKRILDRVRDAARSGQLDVLIFNNLAFYDTFPLTRLAQRLGIATIQCYEDERLEVIAAAQLGLARRLFGWNSWAADRWCSGMANQIWVISTYLQHKYARLSGHPERVKLIPTIIDCEAWQLLGEPARNPPLIFYSGAFADQDDMEKLLQALAWLKNHNVRFRMRLLGARPELARVQRLQALAKELGLAELVEFKGFCPAAVVKQEVENANILINLRTNSLWSRSGLSTKLSEYLAAGRTILTTDIGDNARYVEHLKSALVVSSEDPAEKVAEVLKLAIESPEWRQKLGRGAREAALTHFDFPVVQRSLREALQMLPTHK